MLQHLTDTEKYPSITTPSAIMSSTSTVGFPCFFNPREHVFILFLQFFPPELSGLKMILFLGQLGLAVFPATANECRTILA